MSIRRVRAGEGTEDFVKGAQERTLDRTSPPSVTLNQTEEIVNVDVPVGYRLAIKGRCSSSREGKRGRWVRWMCFGDVVKWVRWMCFGDVVKLVWGTLGEGRFRRRG